MIIKKKTILYGLKKCEVVLKKDQTDYIVEVDGTVYKKTPNELFAIQVFNAI